MKQLLALICSTILIVAYAQAQTSTTSSPATSSPATTSTTTNSSAANSSGTVTDYTPGSAITLDPGTGKPVRFVISQRMIKVLGPVAKVMADADVRKNTKVKLNLLKRGNGTLLNRTTEES